MFQQFNRALALLGVSLVTAGFSLANEPNGTIKTKRVSRAQAAVKINIAPVGPTQETVDRIKIAVERSAAVQKELSGKNYRLLSFHYAEQNEKTSAGKFDPQQFSIVFYDYTDDRAIVASGSFADPEAVRITEDAAKPVPSEEELEAAANLVSRSAAFSSQIKNNRLRTFPAMPPTSLDPNTGERLINIGLESLDSSTQNEIVGVSFRRNEVVRYENNAPPTSLAAPEACGIPAGSGGSTSNGTAGQYQMTVAQNGTTLWEFLVIRPSASSGRTSERSGVELRNVKYKGKSVLKRAHNPVLNVEYTDGSCGPYRDWQWQEGAFQAPDAGAQNPAPGIRLLAEGQVATTAMETGNDTGNFRGVAVYRQNNETVLVSEMNAGWYRYIMEWRLADDGTIRPRYGFGATNNSCVCAVHNHHVYWRFDFDVVGSSNKVYQLERGRKFITQIQTERKFNRNVATNRSIMVQNATGDEAYVLVPNLTDGKVDAYGDSDFWVLRYKTDAGNAPIEISDAGGRGTAINLDPFNNNESLDNQDVVVWYGSHFIHADGANIINPDRSGRQVLSGTHVVGPDIRPVRW